MPDTRKKMPLQPNRSGIFCLFVCSLIQLHLGSFLRLFFLLIDFKCRPHGGNVPAAELTLNTGPPAPGPEPCSPSWPPDHSIDRAVDACDSIQHPDFPLLLKRQEPFKALPACQDAYSTLRCAPQQAVTPLCLFVLAPHPLAGTGHTGYHKSSAYAGFSEKMQEFSVWPCLC